MYDSLKAKKDARTFKYRMAFWIGPENLKDQGEAREQASENNSETVGLSQSESRIGTVALCITGCRGSSGCSVTESVVNDWNGLNAAISGSGDRDGRGGGGGCGEIDALWVLGSARMVLTTGTGAGVVPGAAILYAVLGPEDTFEVWERLGVFGDVW
jgi:hypothetical protein